MFYKLQRTVPEYMKDELYWSRRRKNNEAAKQSREAKRRKENQIVMRAAFLENENTKLRDELGETSRSNDAIRKDVKALKEKIFQYETSPFDQNLNPYNTPPQENQHLPGTSYSQNGESNVYQNLL